MATRVEIPGVGTKYLPDGLSDEEINRRVAAFSAPPPIEPEDDLRLDPKDLKPSVLAKNAALRALGGFKSGITDTAAAEMYDLLGDKEEAKRQMAEREAHMAELEKQYPTAYPSWRDIKGMKDIIPAGAEAIGAGGASLATVLGGAGAAALAAPVVGVGAGVAATAGAAATAFGLNQPETFEQIYQETGEMHPGIASVIGAAKTYLDMYLPGKLRGQLTGAAEKDLMFGIIDRSTLPPVFKGKIAEALGIGVKEGLTEGTQEALDIFGGQLAGSKHDPFSTEG